EIDEIVKDPEQLRAHSLVCHRITKKYLHVLAVSCVSFKISPYECFGIMGLNGAGKTSIVDMIVANQSISRGNIYVKGFRVKSQLKHCFKHITLCPQHSTMWNHITGREMLRFTCLTTGIKKDLIPIIILYLAERLMFSKYLDRKIKDYSSGSKRKLNIAMAMLTHTLTCLDEPTTGVDISTKAGIWMVLREMCNMSRSILITSHDVEECEALCTTIGIMVNGQFCCFGSVHELICHYSKGISIKIQLATSAEMDEEKNTSHGLVTIAIADFELKWSTIFKYMEDNRDALQIEHYSIIPPTLEDIYMEFGKQQRTN
ncbi:GH23038, partial [Drosophila grimshawi]